MKDDGTNDDTLFRFYFLTIGFKYLFIGWISGCKKTIWVVFDP